MTAMFVVIFVDNILKEKQHWSSLIGIAGGTIVYMLLVQMMESLSQANHTIFFTESTNCIGQNSY